MRALLQILLLLGCSMALAKPMLGTKFLKSARDIDPANNTVVLPLHPAVLPDGTKAFFIVTEASTAAAAAAWGANHAPAFTNLQGTPLVQVVRGAATPGSVLQVPATVDFTHSKRSITPNPTTIFPPTAFNFSAQGNKGYSPLLQLPDGTILNAPQVALQAANGSLTTHPKVLSVSADKSSVVLMLTAGFSQGQPIVYISTEASDPLAATLENVPFVPTLADTPSAALIDLVAFTNGQTGSSNPQRQGLASAIRDGMSPLNIVATTPATPDAYSPLWAVNLAKWVGSAGDRQTSVQDVQALSAEGKVASFDPKNAAANPPLKPSGIVVNCPIIATVRDASTSGNRDSKQSGGKQMRAGGTCTPSPLGYSCVVNAQDGVRLHYTLGGNNAPSNACTGSTTSGASMSVVDPAPVVASSMLHILLEANSPGYVAVSFPQTPGRMWPADAVIGTTDALGTMPVVKSYYLAQYGVSSADEASGWASSLGLVAPSAGTKLLCFSRALNAPAATVVKSIDPNAALPLNWALGRGNDLVHHASKGSLSLSLDGGAATVDASDSTSIDAFRIAHGALMCAAFVLMMPMAVLMARHKWIFGDKESGTVQSGWFHLHKFLNGAAAVLALAAVILAFVRFRWAGRADTATYYTGHRAVGMTTIAMMLVQVLLGLMRPHLGGKWRPLWRRVHQVWGWLLLMMGTAASYMGISLIHDLSDIPLAWWLGPALAVTGSLLVCGLVLEARKCKLESSGRYNKDDHTVEASTLPKAVDVRPA